MRFLVDTSPAGMEKLKNNPMVAGQLQTPLGKHSLHDGVFAIDNGAFSRFERDAWYRLLERRKEHVDRCLFVTMPDIVGNAKLTMDLYHEFTRDKRTHPYTECWSLVFQDGIENSHISWSGIRHVFVGGSDRFKSSNACADVVKASVMLGIPVHVGRVNGFPRYRRFAELGCETCDGTGVVKDPTRFGELIAQLTNDEKQGELFNEHT